MPNSKAFAFRDTTLAAFVAAAMVFVSAAAFVPKAHAEEYEYPMYSEEEILSAIAAGTADASATAMDYDADGDVGDDDWAKFYSEVNPTGIDHGDHDGDGDCDKDGIDHGEDGWVVLDGANDGVWNGLPVVEEPADTTAPETTIDKYPSDMVDVDHVSFDFSSSEEGSTFQCWLNDGDKEDCMIGHEYTALANGDYTFYVAAKDMAGNEDMTPAEHSFTVAVPAPEPEPTAAEVACAAINDLSVRGVKIECETTGDNAVHVDVSRRGFELSLDMEVDGVDGDDVSDAIAWINRAAKRLRAIF